MSAATPSIDFKDQKALQALVSDTFSDYSPPVTVTQDMINQFADLSGDHMWMHVDVKRCAEQSPFGRPIAHGFLILSMISRLPCGDNPLEMVSGYRHVMNYGSDKLRFLNPVPVDSAIHARSRICAVEVGEKKTTITSEVQVSVVGAEQPSLIYQLAFVLL